MASTEQSLTGSELNAAITSGLLRIHHAHFNRGPRNARTLHHGDVIVAIMEGVLTHAARRLVREGYAAEVRKLRELFLKGLEADCSAVVERLTGRRVVAFIGSSHPEADISAWIFTLDGDVSASPAGAAESHRDAADRNPSNASEGLRGVTPGLRTVPEGP